MFRSYAYTCIFVRTPTHVYSFARLDVFIRSHASARARVCSLHLHTHAFTKSTFDANEYEKERDFVNRQYNQKRAANEIKTWRTDRIIVLIITADRTVHRTVVNIIAVRIFAVTRKT